MAWTEQSPIQHGIERGTVDLEEVSQLLPAVGEIFIHWRYQKYARAFALPLTH
jgi:hypothetical protein